MDVVGDKRDFNLVYEDLSDGPIKNVVKEIIKALRMIRLWENIYDETKFHNITYNDITSRFYTEWLCHNNGD